MNQADVKAFHDEATSTVTYVVSDPATKRAAIIDPVHDFDAASGGISTESADSVVAFVRDQGLEIDWILETHVHADHLSGAPYLREHLGGKTAIGANVTAVQEIFKGVFNLEDFATDGSQFDHLFAAGESFSIGEIAAQVIETPGHTPACITYVIGDAGFVDLPGGGAAHLYDSIRRILALPDETRLFMCHDYKAPGRDHFAWETSVAEQRTNNIHINDEVSKDAFVEMREGRDKELGMPKLILPSLQVNLRAGRLPPPEDNGTRYLKIPLDTTWHR